MLSEMDASGEKEANELRARFPAIASCVDDFYLILVCPAAFNFTSMPKGWQRIQRILAAEHFKINAQLQIGMVKGLANLAG